MVKMVTDGYAIFAIFTILTLITIVFISCVTIPTMSKAAKVSKKLVQKAEPTASVLRPYELTVVVSPTVKAEKRADVISSLKTMAEDSSGKVLKVDEWGLKDLAYPINHQMSGWYVFLLLKLPSSAIAKLQMSLGREKTILRHLLVTP